MNGWLSKAKKSRAFYRNHGKQIVFKIAMYYILITLAFVFLYPFLRVIVSSFKSASDLMNVTVTWVPLSAQPVENYTRAWKALQYTPHLLNSLLLSVLPTFGAVASAAFVGYGFARYHFKGREILFVLVLLTMIVPPQSVIIPLYELYNSFGWLNQQTPILSTLPLVLPNFFANGLKGGLFVFIFRQTFRGLPVELEEASRLDGCGMFKSFLYVAIPSSGSAILVSTILSIVWQWNEYFLGHVFLIKKEIWPLPMMLENIFSNYFSSMEDAFSTFNYAIVAASMVLVMLPMLIFYFLVQRLFIKGIERTGLVG